WRRRCPPPSCCSRNRCRSWRRTRPRRTCPNAGWWAVRRDWRISRAWCAGTWPPPTAAARRSPPCRTAGTSAAACASDGRARLACESRRDLPPSLTLPLKGGGNPRRRHRALAPSPLEGEGWCGGYGGGDACHVKRTLELELVALAEQAAHQEDE